MRFSKNRKCFIFQEESAIHSTDSCYVVLCIRTLPISIFYVDRYASGYGNYPTSLDCDDSDDNSFHLYVICMEEKIRENEIRVV